MDSWKTQLTLANNFISSIYTNEEHVMHSKSDNLKIMINDKEGEVIEELFQSFLSINEIGLETTIKVRNFNFDFIDLLYYKCHKTNLNCVDQTRAHY